ncbi:MAG: PA2779 family protein [Gammaproteobacteria bacterium]|nr:PA2779 family protein [Gammaproteobacteria bacterium]
MLKRFATRSFLTASLTCFSLSAVLVPVSQAAVIGTQQYAQINQSIDKGQLQAFVAQNDVKQQLISLGVSPEQVQARVDAMTDEEVQQLAGQLQQLPAGGDIVGLLIFFFVLFVITDMLGATDIFPFVKPVLK